MNRKEAAELSPFIKAFGEGKDIEMRSKNQHAQLNGWAKMDEFIFGNFEYRIKPEPKYRPFANAEECWQEMQKHQPFGWVKLKDTESGYYMLKGIASQVVIGFNETPFSYKKVFEDYAFANGTPFGVKIKEE